ncbi:MAG: MFS transporter [Saprospiraceae bacterium]|nr:MFS transporter [Saprospiraceae bacterium]
MTNQTRSKDIVPTGQKIAFGAGNLTNQLLPAALGVFMFFLVVGFGMSPYKAGILAAIPRFMDAILDPIMGYISDNTRSRWGRRRPYIFVGAIVVGLSFIAMWQLKLPEQGNNHETFNFIYFLAMSVIFYLGYTVFAAPLIGLGYEMTPDYNERTRLMAISQIMGQIAWMIAPWFWFLISRPELFPNAPAGVRSLSYWVGGLCLIMGIMPALFCKEIDQSNITGQSKLSLKDLVANVKHFFSDIKKTINNKPFLRLCGATFLVFNGFQIVAQFAFFIIIFYLFNGNQPSAGQWPAWFGTVSALMTALLVIPIITYMSTKIGKKNAFIVSTLISIFGYALKWWGFHPGMPWLMFMPIPLMSFGIGGLFTLMMSMTADVCDLDELKNGMPRKEALFGAVYWWMVKLGTSLALFLSGVILSAVGFNQNVEVQSASTITNLRLADICIPVIAGILAMIVMWKYDISEKRAKEIREELVARRGEL